MFERTCEETGELFHSGEVKTYETLNYKIGMSYSATLRTPCHNHLLDQNLENLRLVLQAAFSLSWVPGRVIVVAQVLLMQKLSTQTRN